MFVTVAPEKDFSSLLNVWTLDTTKAWRLLTRTSVFPLIFSSSTSADRWPTSSSCSPAAKSLGRRGPPPWPSTASPCRSTDVTRLPSLRRTGQSSPAAPSPCLCTWWGPRSTTVGPRLGWLRACLPFLACSGRLPWLPSRWLGTCPSGRRLIFTRGRLERKYLKHESTLLRTFDILAYISWVLNFKFWLIVCRTLGTSQCDSSKPVATFWELDQYVSLFLVAVGFFPFYFDQVSWDGAHEWEVLNHGRDIQCRWLVHDLWCHWQLVRFWLKKFEQKLANGSMFWSLFLMNVIFLF